MRDARCGMRDWGRGMREVGCVMRDALCGMKTEVKNPVGVPHYSWRLKRNEVLNAQWGERCGLWMPVISRE